MAAETISLKDLFLTVRKRIAMIISVTLIGVIASAVYTFYFITPIYQSSTQILVNQTKGHAEQAAPDLSTSLQVINTYSVIIKSPVILEEVSAQLDTNVSTDQVNVVQEKGSQVVTITVRHADPKQASIIANTIATVFKERIFGIMSVDGVTVLAKAKVPAAPISPNPTANITMGLAVGLVLSIALSFLLEYMDNTIKKEQDVEAILQIPVLGVVTQIKEERNVVMEAVKKVTGNSLGA